MTEDITQWLGAQLDEDEKVAFTAGHTLAGELALRWAAVGAYVYPEEVTDNEPPVASADLMDDMPGYEVARARALHIAGWDPSRVLREIDAKRGVLRQYESVREQVRNPASAENRMRARVAQGELEDVLRLLALPYADRPGYRDEWKP